WSALAVGPEGGWSDAELQLGLPLVALADATLRAETAAVVAGALLCGLRGGLVAAAINRCRRRPTLYIRGHGTS
ncbi:MAG: 16S rRNA (uracil(1498)-N(3))-methyltransferase, partial [Acidimicrobiales bacterium]